MAQPDPRTLPAPLRASGTTLGRVRRAETLSDLPVAQITQILIPRIRSSPAKKDQGKGRPKGKAKGKVEEQAKGKAKERAKARRLVIHNGVEATEDGIRVTRSPEGTRGRQDKVRH